MPKKRIAKRRTRATWYAVHILVATKRTRGKQRVFPVYENVVLFRGTSVAGVIRRAQAFGRREYEGDDTVTLNGHPARHLYVGIRKIIECQESTEFAIRYPRRRVALVEGTEVTYLELHVSGKRDFERLIRGEPVTLTYQS